MARRILYGYRDDLNLSERWWHRLLFVLATIVVLLVAGITFVTYLDGAVAAAKTVETKDTYIDFVKRNAKDTQEIWSISLFASGETTHCVTPTDDDTLIRSYTDGAENSFCTKPEFVNDLLAQTIRIYGEKADVSQNSLLESDMNRNHGVVCVISAKFPDCAIESIKTTQIVDHPISDFARGEIAGATTMSIIMSALFIANIYHRVFLYIIFGKRKPIPAQA